MPQDTEDGLCTMCHMSLCQVDAIECKRCVDICDKLLKWVQQTNLEEEDLEEDEL